MSGNATTATTASATTATLTRGSYLTGSNFNGSSATTWAVDAATANTASKIVARDASGNFSAGTITAALSGNASTATTLQTARNIGGVSFNGSADINLPGVNTAGNQSTSGNAATATLAANSTLAGGLAVSSGVNSSANQIVRTNASGYADFGWINTISGDAGTAAINRIYASSDAYIRYYTPTNFRTVLDVPTRGGSGASGTWGINVTGSSGSCTGNAATATTATTANALATGNNYQMNSLGVGTGPSGTAGEIRATNQVTAYYSDDRLKTKLGEIENALDKIDTLSGFYYEANQTAQDLGYEVGREVGVSAQSVQAIMPEVVAPAPIDEKYLTVRYERLVPLLIQGIKELRAEIKALKGE